VKDIRLKDLQQTRADRKNLIEGRPKEKCLGV
jgi:hypothetical protein